MTAEKNVFMSACRPNWSKFFVSKNLSPKKVFNVTTCSAPKILFINTPVTASAKCLALWLQSHCYHDAKMLIVSGQTVISQPIVVGGVEAVTTAASEVTTQSVDAVAVAEEGTAIVSAEDGKQLVPIGDGQYVELPEGYTLIQTEDGYIIGQPGATFVQVGTMDNVLSTFINCYLFLHFSNIEWRSGWSVCFECSKLPVQTLTAFF